MFLSYLEKAKYEFINLSGVFQLLYNIIPGSDSQVIDAVKRFVKRVPSESRKKINS